MGLSTMNLSPYPHLYLNIFIFLGFTTPRGNESHKLTMWHTQKPLPFCIVRLLLGCNLITYGNVSKTSIFLYFKVTWQCIVNSLYLSCQKVLIVVACCLLYVTSTFVDLCSLSLSDIFFLYQNYWLFRSTWKPCYTPAHLCHTLLGLFPVASM